MFCEICGKQIPEGETLCPYCHGVHNAPEKSPEKSPMDYSAVSLILGIVGLFCFGCCMPLVNIIGIIFGVKANKLTGRKAGLILNIIGLILSVLLPIAIVVFICILNAETTGVVPGPGSYYYGW